MFPIFQNIILLLENQGNGQGHSQWFTQGGAQGFLHYNSIFGIIENDDIMVALPPALGCHGKPLDLPWHPLAGGWGIKICHDIWSRTSWSYGPLALAPAESLGGTSCTLQSVGNWLQELRFLSRKSINIWQIMIFSKSDLRGTLNSLFS